MLAVLGGRCVGRVEGQHAVDFPSKLWTKQRLKKKNKKGGSFVKGKMERGDDEEGRSKTPLVILISYCLTLYILSD
jgi:hypothetical protein